MHCASDCADLFAYVVQIKNVSGYCSLRFYFRFECIVRDMKGLSGVWKRSSMESVHIDIFFYILYVCVIASFVDKEFRIIYEI